jgi:MFS family permease
VFRYNKRHIFSGVIGGLAPLSFATFAAAFLLNYAVVAGHSRTDALIAMTIANFLNIFTLPMFGALSDRVGRRLLMISGAVTGIVVIWPIFMLVQQQSFWALALSMVLAMPVVQAMMGGVFNTWISEKFAADVRYSGIALTFQIASTLGAGLSPLIAASLLALGGGTNPQWVAVYFAVICALSCIAYIYSRDHFDQELATTTEPQHKPESSHKFNSSVQQQLT